MPLTTLNFQPTSPLRTFALRKLPVRAVIGYALLTLSVLVSVTTLVLEKDHSHLDVYEATSPIIKGTRITPKNAKIVTISTSNRSLAKQFLRAKDTSPIYARITISSGQVLEKGDLTSNPASPGNDTEMVLALKSSQAPFSQLTGGDYLDLITTVGSGASAFSRVVARAARIIEVSKPASGYSQGDQSGYILLSLTDPIEPVALAQAETTGQLVAIKVPGPSAPAFQGTFSAVGPTSTSAVQ